MASTTALTPIGTSSYGLYVPSIQPNLCRPVTRQLLRNPSMMAGLAISRWSVDRHVWRERVMALGWHDEHIPAG